MCSPIEWMDVPQHWGIPIDAKGDWTVYPNTNPAVGIACWCGQLGCNLFDSKGS